MAVTLLSITAIFLSTACSQDADNPEAEILAYIAAGEAATQKRDVFAIKSMIADEYLDKKGRNQQNVVSITAGYFFRHKNIHTLTRVKQLTFPQPVHANLVLLVGLAGDPIGDFEHLLALRATIHRFEMQLVKQAGEWQLLSAQWRRASHDDFISSESL